jgi:hypothetical protein
VASSLLASTADTWSSPAESERMNAVLQSIRTTSYQTVNDRMGIFDTPDRCVERLQRVGREFGAGRVICWFNFFGAIPHERVLASMELFSAKVLPYV